MTENTPGLLDQIFNTIPLPIFLVDEDVMIYQANRAASAVLEDPDRTFYRKKGGEALHCIHAAETPEGCGHAPACSDCAIRNAVKSASQGGEVNRKKTVMQLHTGTGIKEVPLLVTAAPLVYQGEKFTLLILENIGELLELRNLLPICAWCKKIRTDENYWLSIEEYFGAHHDIDFSHGMCDACYKKMYPEKP